MEATPPKAEWTFDRDRLARAVERERAGRSYRDAAAAAGVQASLLQRLERDGDTPQIENLLKLCTWLDRAPGDFFSSSTAAPNTASLRDQLNDLCLAAGMDDDATVVLLLLWDRLARDQARP